MLLLKKKNSSEKNFVVEEKKRLHWYRWHWKLREFHRFVFIDEECGNLIVVKDGGELTRNIPMDTFSLIRHRFDVEVLCGKFVEITSILKNESAGKLWHRFDMEIMAWIRLSKSMKYRWVLHVDSSTLFGRRIDVASVLAVSIVLFPNIFCSGMLFHTILV